MGCTFSPFPVNLNTALWYIFFPKCLWLLPNAVLFLATTCRLGSTAVVSCLMPTKHLDIFLDMDFTIPKSLSISSTPDQSVLALYKAMCRRFLLFLILARSRRTKADSQSTHSWSVLKSTRTEAAAPTCTLCFYGTSERSSEVASEHSSPAFSEKGTSLPDFPTKHCSKLINTCYLCNKLHRFM